MCGNARHIDKFNIRICVYKFNPCKELSTFVGCIIYYFIYRSAIKKEAEKLTIEN